MKIILNTALLSKALSEISFVVPNKPSIPILKYAKFTVSAGRIKIEANSLQSYIVKVIDVLANDTDGVFLVPCEELLSLVSKLKDETITATIDGNTLQIQYALGTAKFQTVQPEDFPAIEIATEDVTEVQVPASLLADSIIAAKNFTAGNDEMREILKTIYVFVENNNFGYCATNTRLLITDTRNDERITGANATWFISPVDFATIVKACDGADMATIKVTPQQVSYKIGDTVIISCQNVGKYPDYKRIIPQTHSIACRIEKSQLKEMLIRASLATDVTQCVRIHIDNVNISVSSDDINQGKQISETTLHSGCNGDITFAMSLPNMLTCLNACNTNNIAIFINDNSRPVMFYDETTPNKKIIGMPMMINY